MIANDYLSTPFPRSTSQAPSSAYERLRLLSEQYPFNVHEVVHRPPHQMFLQACHFVVGTIISQSTEEHHQGLIMKSAQSLQLFEQSWSRPETCGIPSILAILCHLMDAAITNDTSSPPALKSNFCQATSKLSTIWMGCRCELDAKGIEGISIWTPVSAPTLSGQVFGFAATRPFSIPPNMVPEARSQPNVHNAFDSNMNDDSMVYAYPQDPSNYGSMPQQSQHLDPESGYGRMSIDQPGHGNVTLPTKLAMQKGSQIGLGTSPSFNGDDIDALFHEMARLDTDQWMIDRSKGLEEFGFKDDSTFEAFCNDPSRLMLSDVYMGPIFNNGDSVPLKNQALGPNAEGAQLGNMSFEDIFR